MGKGFKIVGTVITPGNYAKYNRGELCDNLVYEPAEFRPPSFWYQFHSVPVPVEAQAIRKDQPKKPGRKAGTAERTARLEIRCTPELLTVLRALTKESWAYSATGFTISDMVHLAVRNLSRGQFPNASEELTAAIEQLHEHVIPISY